MAASMEYSQRVLFGKFPRNGGRPNQFALFSEQHFDYFVETASQNGFNTYSTISWLPPSDPRCDKVFFDLDASYKGHFEAGVSEVDVFETLRGNPDLADAILGDVIEDMRALVEASIEDDIPVLGVYSGLGVHVYQLYQEETLPKAELKSTVTKYEEELGLETVDGKPKGKVVQLGRVPNASRYDKETGESTGVWVIPLTAEEMLEYDATDLLDASTSPRALPPDPAYTVLSARPEMEVYDDYLSTRKGRTFEAEPKPLEGPGHLTDETVEYLVDRYVRLPCMRERVKSLNPDHIVRQNFAVLLFNIGMTPPEACDFIEQLGWKDYKREKTMYQLKNIWRGEYGDKSCRTLREQGYCIYEESERPSCRTYDWSGGDCNWKK